MNRLMSPAPARTFDAELKRLESEPVKPFVFIDFATPEYAANPETAHALLLGTPSYIRYLGSLDERGFVEHVESWRAHLGLVGARRPAHSTTGQMEIMNRLFPASNRVSLILVEGITRQYWSYVGRLSMRVHDFAALEPTNPDSPTLTKIAAVMNAVLHVSTARRSMYFGSMSMAPSFSIDSLPLHDLMIVPSDAPRNDFKRFIYKVLMHCQASGLVHKDNYVCRRKCVDVERGGEGGQMKKESVMLPYYEPYMELEDFLMNFNPMTGASDPSAEAVDGLTLPNNVNWFSDFASRMSSYAKYFERYNSAMFPRLAPRRELYCFLDGIYNVDTDRFITLDELGPRSFCINFINEMAPRAVRLSTGLGLDERSGKQRPSFSEPFEHTFFPYDCDPRKCDEVEIEEARERLRERLRERFGDDDDDDDEEAEAEAEAETKAERRLDALEADLDPMNIPTPEVDFLLDYQWYDKSTPRDKLPVNLPATCIVKDKEVVRRFFYAMIGRMFHPVRQMENWQVFNLLVGYANTGKSLMVEAVLKMIGDENVGVLSATTERGWELSAGLDTKLAMVCPELGETHNLPVTDLLSMAAGEVVTIKNKNMPQRHVRWKAPMWFLGNQMSNWKNTHNNVMRRQVTWMWDRIVALHRRDETLQDRILANLGPLLVKSNRMYLALVRHIKRHSIRSFFDVLPKYNMQCSRRILQQVDPLSAFMDSGLMIYGSKFMCPLDVIRRMFERYCRDHCVKAPSMTGSGAEWLKPKFADYSLGFHADLVGDDELAAAEKRATNIFSYSQDERSDAEPERFTGFNEEVGRSRNGSRAKRARVRGAMDRYVQMRSTGPVTERVTTAAWPDYFIDQGPRVKAVFITGISLNPREWDDELASRYGVSKKSIDSISLEHVRPEYRPFFQAIRVEGAYDMDAAIRASQGSHGSQASPSVNGADRPCMIGRRVKS